MLLCRPEPWSGVQPRCSRPSLSSHGHGRPVRSSTTLSLKPNHPRREKPGQSRLTSCLLHATRKLHCARCGFHCASGDPGESQAAPRILWTGWICAASRLLSRHTMIASRSSFLDHMQRGQNGVKAVHYVSMHGNIDPCRP